MLCMEPAIESDTWAESTVFVKQASSARFL